MSIHIFAALYYTTDGEYWEKLCDLNQFCRDGEVHSVTGVRIGDSLNDLPRGIYIQNGKKVLVK